MKRKYIAEESMKKTIFIIFTISLFGVFTSNSFALNKVIVIYKADQSIVVIHPDPKGKLAGETDGDFFGRVYSNAVEGTELEGRSYENMLKSQLPNRKSRGKWRGDKEGGIKIDHSVITPTEKRQALEDDIDIELAKASPDSVKILKLQRKLYKKEY